MKKLYGLGSAVASLLCLTSAHATLTPAWTLTSGIGADCEIGINGTNLWLAQANGVVTASINRYNLSGVLQSQININPTFGTMGGNLYAISVNTDSSGNAYCAYWYNAEGTGGLLLLKANSSGTLQWYKTYPSIKPLQMVYSSAGHLFILASVGTSTYEVVEYDTNGNVIGTPWTVAVSGGSGLTPSSLTVLNDKPYVAGQVLVTTAITGFIASPALASAYVAPLNGPMDPQWFSSIATNGTSIFTGGETTTYPYYPQLCPLWTQSGAPTGPFGNYAPYLAPPNPINHNVDAPLYTVDARQIAFDSSGNQLYGGVYVTNNATTGGIMIGKVVSGAWQNALWFTASSNGVAGLVYTSGTVWMLDTVGDASDPALYKFSDTSTGVAFIDDCLPTNHLGYFHGVVPGPTGECYTISDDSLQRFN